MLDETFCIELEYAISKTLANSTDVDWRRCWCDGILLPGNQDDGLPQYLPSNGVAGEAWIDEGYATTRQRGQFLYRLKLRFGDYSLNALLAGGRLEPCIPDTTADHWIILDRQRRMLEVQLL